MKQPSNIHDPLLTATASTAPELITETPLESTANNTPDNTEEKPQEEQLQLQLQLQLPHKQHPALRRLTQVFMKYHAVTEKKQKQHVKLHKAKQHSSKHVRFAPIIRIRDRPSHPDAWYKRTDFAHFEHERRETVCAVHQAKGDVRKLDMSKHCLRGLEEVLSRRTALHRRKHMMQQQQVVLAQQKFQKGAGKWEPETLRAASRIFSQKSTKRAHLRALIAEATEQQDG